MRHPKVIHGSYTADVTTTGDGDHEALHRAFQDAATLALAKVAEELRRLHPGMSIEVSPLEDDPY